MRVMKNLKQISSTFRFDKIIIDKETAYDLAIAASIHALTVHFVALPLALVETSVGPDVFAFAESIAIYELAIIVVFVGESVSTVAMLFTVPPVTIIHITSLHSQYSKALFFVPYPTAAVEVSIIITIFSLSLSQAIDPSSLVFVQISVSHCSQSILVIFNPVTSVNSLRRCHPTYDNRQLTIALLQTSEEIALVDHCGIVSHGSVSVRSIIAKSAFKVCSIAIEYFPFTFLNSIAIHSDKPISIRMNNLSWPIHHCSFPSPLDFNLPIEKIVSAFAMPQIINPFPLINFSSLCIGIGSESMFKLIDEGAFILISIGVAIDALDEGAAIDCLSLESISIGVLYKWLPKQSRHR